MPNPGIAEPNAIPTIRATVNGITGRRYNLTACMVLGVHGELKWL